MGAGPGSPILGLRRFDSLRIRQTGRCNIAKNSHRSRHYQMLGLACADPSCREVAPFAQIGRTTSHIVSIGRENVDVPLVQHSLRPISRISAKGASEGTSRNLHPDTGSGHPADGKIMAPNPGQTLWVGQDWHIVGGQKAEKELLQEWRGDMVRRLDKDIASIGERK